MAKLTTEQRTGLVKFLRESFSSSELDDLCFPIGVDPADLGQGTATKSRELVMWVERRNKVDDLFKAILEAREGEDVDLSPYGYVPGGSIPKPPTTTSTPTSTPTTPVTPTSTTLSYENFDLRIGRKGADGLYPIEVTKSPTGGEMAEPYLQKFPLDDYNFTDLVGYLKDLMARSADAVELGKMMKNLLFPGEVWNIYFASRHATKQQGKGLRIRLRIDAPELSQLPWEYVYDETFGGFFALQRETPLVRYLPRPFTADSITAPTPMKVLVAIAAPKNLPALNVDAEEQYIRKTLAFMGENVQLTVLRNATPDRLHGALATRPHVFHFIGHGDLLEGKGALAFENAQGQMQLVDAEQLRQLMASSGLKVVILNACKSAAHDGRAAMLGVAPALVNAEIPAVIAMQASVPDKTALGFTRDLYRFLAAGFPLDTAVTEMRLGAYISGSDKYFWGIPTLFMRSPDGVLWQPNPELLQRFAEAIAAAPDIVSEPDAGQQLDDLIKQVEAAKGPLNPGDADDVISDLNDVKTMLSTGASELRRMSRKMDNVIGILNDSSAASAKELAAQAQKLYDKIKQQFS